MTLFVVLTTIFVCISVVLFPLDFSHFILFITFFFSFWFFFLYFFFLTSLILDIGRGPFSLPLSLIDL